LIPVRWFVVAGGISAVIIIGIDVIEVFQKHKSAIAAFENPELGLVTDFSDDALGARATTKITKVLSVGRRHHAN
jgi:hypothetical protein